MKVKVNVYTCEDFFGDEIDYAEVEITNRLRERVGASHRTLNELGADFLEEFDCTPDFRFVDGDTRIDVVRLVVAKDGDFWWQGYVRNTDIRWETGHIPFALLVDEPNGGERDLREYKDDETEEEASVEGTKESPMTAETRCTPGDWTVFETDEGFVINTLDEQYDPPIALVHSEADAWLIAAAKDLLSAAKHIDAVSPAQPGDGSSPLQPDELCEIVITGQALLDLRAAIAKAGGDAPLKLLDEPDGDERDLRKYMDDGEAEMESGAARGGAA